MSAVLKHIADLAKDLNNSEMHVLVELASRAETAGGHDAIASSRDLAERTGLVRASVQAAIDSLNKKGLIWSDTGSATRAACHRLLFLDAVEIREGGPTVRPGVAQNLSQGGLKNGPVVAQKLGQGGSTVRPQVAQILSPSGLNSGPPLNEESSTCEPAHIENASAPAESIEKDDFKDLIDRIQNSKKAYFDDEVFEAARNLIASHHAKFAREGCQLPGKPDDQITAQFLAIADWPRLSRMLHDLLTERQSTSFSWAWYVTVALQRVHGISPDKARGIRATLRNGLASGARTLLSSRPMTPCHNAFVLAHGESYYGRERRLKPTTDMGGLGDQLKALATAKSMR